MNGYHVLKPNDIKINLDGVYSAFVHDFSHKFIYFEGALGLGKTFTTLAKCLVIAKNQKPLDRYNEKTNRVEKVRSTRILITRKNYTQLLDGIFKDAKALVGNMPHKVYSLRESTNPHPIIHIQCRLGDGTIMDTTWIFKALEFESDLDKIHGIALTCAVMDEGNEQNEYIFTKLSQRVCRYPSPSLIEPSDSFIKKRNDIGLAIPNEIESALNKQLELEPLSSRFKKIDRLLSQDNQQDTIQDNSQDDLQQEPIEVFNADLPSGLPEEFDNDTSFQTDFVTWGGIIITANPPDVQNWVYRRLIQDRIIHKSSGNPLSVYYRLPPVFFRTRELTPKARFEHNGWYYIVNPEATGIRFNSSGIDYWEEGVVSMGNNDIEIQRMYLGLHTRKAEGDIIFKDDFRKDLHVLPNYMFNLSSDKSVNVFFDYGVNSACAFSQRNDKGGLTFFKLLYLPEGDFDSFMTNMVMPYVLDNLRHFFFYIGGDSTGRNRLGSESGTYISKTEQYFSKYTDRYEICKLTVPSPEKRIGATRQQLRYVGGLEIVDTESFAIDGFTFGYVSNPKTGLPEKRDKIITVGGVKEKLPNYTHVMDTICDTCYVYFNHRENMEENDRYASKMYIDKYKEEMKKYERQQSNQIYEL